MSWGMAFRIGFTDAYGWALLTPPTWWVARVVPLTTRVGRGVALVAFAALVASFSQIVLHLIVDQVCAILEETPFDLMGHAGELLAHDLLLNPGMFIATFAISKAIQAREEARRRELEAGKLSVRLVDAQLRALQAQLQPHFLFNALNAAVALVRRDPAGAERMITRLADLLRATLDCGDAQEVPLQEELGLLEPYLEIEKVRFGDRLQVHVDVSPDAMRARVPVLLLQPLVENAIRHGLAPRRGPGTIDVRAERVGERLVVQVLDDGVGPSRESRPGGFGLSGTRERLECLYGDAHELELVARPDGGAAVRVVIPYAEGGRG